MVIIYCFFFNNVAKKFFVFKTLFVIDSIHVLWLFADSQKWDHQVGVMTEETSEDQNCQFLKFLEIYTLIFANKNKGFFVRTN
jgi:hypothetical protein